MPCLPTRERLPSGPSMNRHCFLFSSPIATLAAAPDGGRAPRCRLPPCRSHWYTPGIPLPIPMFSNFQQGTVQAKHSRCRPCTRNSTMLVELRDIRTIQPYANNPRRNDHAVAAVAASIQAFGFRQPIVVDEAGIIVVGSTRYKAALLLGLEQVPVHVATGLTPAQVKAYRLADNKTAELAEWDDTLLVQEIA